jgi:outer membrane protein assembly factor BamB
MRLLAPADARISAEDWIGRKPVILKKRFNIGSLSAIAVLIGMLAAECGPAPKFSPDPSVGTTGAIAVNAGQTVNRAAAPADGTANVLTYHNDNARTGQDLDEKTLTLANVNSASFGKIGFLSTQGRVDAEPLYVSGLRVNGAKHNVVFIATEHDLVYAFDADTFQKLWEVSLLEKSETPSDDRGCGQVTPEIGVTSTPVIDLHAGPHGALYAIAMSKNASGNYFQRLHALDITSGAELPGSPQTIEASYPGSAQPNQNGRVIFDPKQYKERAGLLLLHGVIYTSWASHCDFDPYSGWIIGYDAKTLKQASVLNITPNGSEGAIWMSGVGLAADNSSNIYFLDGNGTFDTALDASGFPSHGDYGNAFLKLSTAGGTLAVADYFDMYGTVQESRRDLDLGSGGALVLPDLADSSGRIRHLAVGAGKDNIIYLVDRDAMGKFNPARNTIYEEIRPTGEEHSQGLGGSGGVYSSPAYFHQTLYYGAVDDSLRAFRIANAWIQNPAGSKTAVRFGYPGTSPSISANGNANGIVWAVENNSPAVLHAYDASDLTHELYNSNQSRQRDEITGNKFITPMIANGKVFVGTPSGVAVFGLLH